MLQAALELQNFLLGPFLEFSFMRRAVIGCLAIALGATPVGVFLVLRRMSLTGDAMAHAILPGAAVGYLVSGLSIGAMTAGGLAAGLAVAFLAGFVTRSTILREDASLAAFYLISLAAGVLIVSTRGNSIDLLHVLFGSVLALDDGALFLLAGVSSFTLVALAFLYRPLVLECFDPAFLRSVSRASSLAHYGFLALAVLNLVAGFHALGTLMVVGIMVLPAAAARFWARSAGGMMTVAVLTAFLSSLTGLLLSYHYSLTSGPAIVLTAGGLYVFSLVFGRVGSLVARRAPRRHLEG